MIARNLLASTSAQEIVTLNARLRLACLAIGPQGVDPRAIRLEDVCPMQARELMEDATEDFWGFIEGRG
jgi:hypothetical protein